MLIYTSTKSRKVKKKPKAVREQNEQWLKKHGSDGKKYKQTFTASTSTQKPVMRESSKHIPSLETTGYTCGKKSIMDPVALAKEQPEVRDAIIAKSKRIAIHYNKGAYQYVTDGIDIKQIGSAERLRRGG